jgi:L-lysine 2,3-aminomutase
MSGVTGGTVTVYFGPYNYFVLQPGTGTHNFEWPNNTTVIIMSSNGKRVSGFNKPLTSSDETLFTQDDSEYDPDAPGPDLTLS